MSPTEFVRLTDEQLKARKRRNLAIGLGLVAFIVLIYSVTVSRMHTNNQARLEQEAAAASVVADVEAASVAAAAQAAPDAVPAGEGAQ